MSTFFSEKKIEKPLNTKDKIKQFHYRPIGLQEAETTRFADNRHMKVVRLSAVCTSSLNFPGNIPGTRFC
jgi:hypothetical protein